MDLLQPGNQAVYFIAANEKVDKKGQRFSCRRLQICSKMQLVRDAGAVNWDEFPFHIYTYNYLRHLYLPAGRSACTKQLSAYKECALQGWGFSSSFTFPFKKTKTKQCKVHLANFLKLAPSPQLGRVDEYNKSRCCKVNTADPSFGN